MTPGCTTAIRAVPGSLACGTQAHAAAAAAPHAVSPASATVRARATAISTATATFTMTSRKPSSHTPPTEASRSAGATCHWLAPSSPHGPPRYSQERTSSAISQADGSTTSAAATRPEPGRPCSSRCVSHPQGAHNSPSSSASTTMNTCRLGISQWCAASRNPAPPSQPSSTARRPVGAERTRSSQGTRAAYAHHHSEGSGKAGAGSAPTSSAIAPRHHGEASRRPHRSSPSTGLRTFDAPLLLAQGQCAGVSRS
ncbi:hypothetical protein SANT12839_012520 [Streptomyces antimycoticus]|uniref:Uncharacterized protein n=1 Tax=Streptomyces antimycoticus TaxID=68175 RepID=A0A4D4JZW8_9ACTN|nr:hypothetical protein SANT12839_012520 [Streptomyces antimycoticus]